MNSHKHANLLSQTITVPGVTLPFVQNYTYDSLNRLESAEEKPSSWTQTNCDNDPTKCWKQTFKYDRYGNRNFNTAGTNTTTLPANFDPKIFNPTIDTDDNRFEAGQGYSYDAAGNTTRDAESRKFTYDAENKQTKVETLDGGGNPIATVGEYFYDGDGKRVKKVVPGGETTIFVYDAGGKLIQEHSTIVQDEEDAETVYTTNDHLGSPRINTDATGQVISRHDYHPFGEEIDRSSFSYGSDTIRKQFTGYERDGETGLDFAQARYHKPALGRFSTPDPMLLSAKVESPQSWNRYSYVENNPLRYRDPTGLFIWSNDLGGDRDDDELRADELAKANKIKDPKKRAKAIRRANGRVDKIVAKRNEIRSAIVRAKESLANLSGSQKESVQTAISAFGEEGTTNLDVVLGQWSGGGTGGSTMFGENGKIFVMLGNVTGDNLAAQFAHEGSHVADFQAFLNGGIDSISNMTLRESEITAWSVSAYTAKGLGMESYARSLPNNLRVWNKGWTESQIAIAVSNRVAGPGYENSGNARMSDEQTKNIQTIRTQINSGAWSNWY